MISSTLIKATNEIHNLLKKEAERCAKHLPDGYCKWGVCKTCGVNELIYKIVYGETVHTKDIDYLKKIAKSLDENGSDVIVYVDGACAPNPGPMGIGVFSDIGINLSKYVGIGTNNLAEWTALEEATKLLKEKVDQLEGKNVTIKMDSELVVNQVNGKYGIRDPKLHAIFLQVKKTLSSLKTVCTVRVEWCNRAENKADTLATKSIKYQKLIEEFNI